MQRRRFHFDELRAARANRFAARLADVLHELGITHKALAQQLGITHYAVDSWTRAADPTLPAGENLERLCALLEARKPGVGRELAVAAGHPWKPPDTSHPDAPPRNGHEATAPPGNLPVAFSSFVGRADDIAAVADLLGQHRLITLTGPGGIGKTRLALQVAERAASRFPQGVWLVELGALTDPALLPQAVATILGVREQAGRPLLATVAEYLGRRETLLILDNCEHLVEAGAALVTRLLGTAPGVRVLATSREPLRVGGEVAWRVPPLALPDPRQQPPPDALVAYEAPRLFVERARLGQPRFALTAANAGPVVQICRRLDGVPLALELAAACLRVLAVDQIAAHLDDRFRLLTDGGRDALPRHHTLRAAIEWSYDLLAPPEKTLFTRLAVFAGGWTLDAAEAVGADAGREAEVLDLLKALVDKSLVVVEEGERAARYRMLETIRAYGLEQLAAQGEEAAIRARHAAYFRHLAETADQAMHGPDQPAWLHHLEREHDNLRAALAWAIESGDTETALRFGRALTLFWFFHGHFSEGRRWLEAVLAVDPPELAPLRPWALNGAGVLACFQGDFTYAGARFAESIALAERLGDEESIAFSLTSLSGAALYQNDVPRAVALAEESLAIFRRYDTPWNVGLAITNLIPALLGQGRLDDAMRLAQERLALYRGLGNPWGIASSYTNLGLVASAQGAVGEAEAYYRQGLGHFVALGDKWGSYEALAGLAVAVAAQQQFIQAARLFGATDALRDDLAAIAPPAYFHYDQVTAAVRAALGEATYHTAYDAGHALSPEEAVAPPPAQGTTAG
jgi:non-specific serine/threonine protein kinase